jgi:cytochrome b561
MAPFENKTDVGYTPAAKVLHWLVVALLFCQYSIAWTMPDIGRDTKPDRMINLHFSFGVLILLVIAIRLVWRCTHGEPGPPIGLPLWAVRSSRAIHYLLYPLLALLPLLGWTNASFRGFDVSLFGLLRPAAVDCYTRPRLCMDGRGSFLVVELPAAATRRLAHRSRALPPLDTKGPRASAHAADGVDR